MLKDFIPLAIGAVFGLGTAMASLAAPIYFPSTPQWALHWLFWGGIFLMILMVFDGAILLFWHPRFTTALLLNIGLLFLASTAIFDTAPRTELQIIDLSKYEGELFPASDVDPNTNMTTAFGNALAVELGSGVALASQFPHTIIRMAGDEMLTINRDSATGHIRVTTLQIFDDRKDSIATMDDGHFWVKFGSKKKRPDKSTLVVYDHLNKEVLRIRFLNPHAISVQGLFRHPKRAETIEITDKFLQIGGISIQKFFFADNAGGDIALQ